jgi:hypothetical protein
MIAFTDTTQLNFVTAQRRLNYYMTNKGQHCSKPNNFVRSVSHPNLTIMPSKPDIPNVDSFKMDYLDGGGYGFAIKFPAKRTQESDQKNFVKIHKSQRPESLQSFEEARYNADEVETPSFVEVHARDLSPLTDGMRRQQYATGESSPVRAKNSSSKSLKDLETMLRLVNENGKSSDIDNDYQDELLTEFNRLNMRTRKHVFRRTRHTLNHPNTGPSVNNRSSVELRAPVFSSFYDGYSDPTLSSDMKDTNTLPEYEPYTTAIPSYSSIGCSSPNTARRQTHR